jgi:hypothetical protein
MWTGMPAPSATALTDSRKPCGTVCARLRRLGHRGRDLARIPGSRAGGERLGQAPGIREAPVLASGKSGRRNAWEPARPRAGRPAANERGTRGR